MEEPAGAAGQRAMRLLELAGGKDARRMQTVGRLTRLLAKLLSIHFAAEHVFIFATALDVWKCVNSRFQG